MPDESAHPPTDRLKSWKEVSAYLQTSVSAARRWEREEGLPVHRQEHIKRGSVIAYKHELDAWLHGRTKTAASPRPRSRRRWLWAASVPVMLLLIAVALSGARDPLDTPDVESLILTSDPGGETSLSFAPDGRRFVYQPENGAGIFLKEPGVEPPKLIFRDPKKRVRSLGWSPDGKRIAVGYSPPENEVGSIGLIDPDGRWIRDLVPGGPYGVTWRRDSRAILYVSVEKPNDPQSAYEYELETGRKRRLSFPPPGSWGDIACEQSPDGRWLALARYPSFGTGDVYVTPYGADEPRQLTRLGNWVVGLDWLPDSSGVAFGGTVQRQEGLFWVGLEGRQEPRLIPGGQGVNRYPKMARPPDGAIRVGYVREVWNADLAVIDTATGKRRALAVSTKGEETPDISDDGKVVFMSQRSGPANLWVCEDIECQAPRQITRLREPVADLEPRWSPDGRRIAFIAREDGVLSLRVLGLAGTDHLELATGFSPSDPSWSADGRFVYFTWTRTGQPEIWKAAADGSSKPRQITSGGGSEAFESRDGRWLYLTRNANHVPIMRREAGDETDVETPVSEVGVVTKNFWMVSGNSIYWLDDRRALKRFDPATGHTVTVLRLPESESATGLSINSAGLVVLSHRGPLSEDLYAIDLRPRKHWRLW